MKNNVIDFNKKNKELVEMANFALTLAKQSTRNVILDRLEAEYANMNIVTRDIIEAFMIDCADVANDLYFITAKEEIKIEDATFRSNIVRKTDEGHAFTIAGVNELTHLKNISDPLAEEIGMYTTLLTKLIAEKDKVEKKVKKDLLSEQNLRQMQKYYRELGMKFDKEEVKQSIKEMLEQYSVVDLMKNNYIS